ncbi:aminoacyl--tRNA ligase-related protein [Buchnera aphidicola (Ceratoglyphina bambusae)]|uniref:aminoacyl--tRNA ligase-related protein n=1 Tax=Buchnera aphidicola TaxID=9 RepID=UPI0031B80C1A
MKTSKYLLFTMKKYKSKLINNELIIRSGLVRKISSGIYSFLPLGIRIINKIKKIIRHEIEKNYAIEIYMPLLQKEFLWKKSGRIKIFGKELFKIIDRKKKKFILSPTHEELITYIFSKEIKSYKSFPITFYQIQNKYRDEIRSKDGIIRCKEFIMKDAYSFHINRSSMQKTYMKMYSSYKKIFKLFKIKYKITLSKSKKMGGKTSHEFHAISQHGENYILIHEKDNISKKIKIKNIIKKENESKTSNKHNFVKIFFIKSNRKKKKKIIIIIKISQTLDMKKIKKYYNDETLYLEENEKNKKFINKIKKINNLIYIKNSILIDKSIINLKNFYIYKKINKTKKINIIKHKKNIFFTNKFIIKKSIEIAHIFQIGKKYSKKLNFFVHDKNKKRKLINMGCYGIGITRLLSSIVEQNHNIKGIIWPSIISPFKVIILPINKHKCNEVKIIAKNVYKYFKKNKIEVIIEDRKISPGEMFNNSDLIGITNTIIINEKNAKKKMVEYKNRILNISKIISIKDIKKYIK